MDQANINQTNIDALIRDNRDLIRQTALDNNLSILTSGNRIRDPKKQAKLLTWGYSILLSNDNLIEEKEVEIRKAKNELSELSTKRGEPSKRDLRVLTNILFML